MCVERMPRHKASQPTATCGESTVLVAPLVEEVAVGEALVEAGEEAARVKSVDVGAVPVEPADDAEDLSSATGVDVPEGIVVEEPVAEADVEVADVDDAEDDDAESPTLLCTNCTTVSVVLSDQYERCAEISQPVLQHTGSASSHHSSSLSE